MLDKLKIGFIGAGNMGEALIKGLLSGNLFTPDRITAYEVSESRLAYMTRTYGISPSIEISALAAFSDIVLIAVKPQVIRPVMSQLSLATSKGQLIISIAAGISLGTLVGALPGASVIRVMPNTPALVLQGASALSRSEAVTNEHMEIALTLFRAVGTAIEVEEKLMDAVTGLSGSGPAYALLFLESLIDAGVLMGLPRPVARELSIQTVLGTVLMMKETGRHPADLRDMITSPGGTTIKGLQVLQEQALSGALMKAVEMATIRSKELGKA